MAGVTVLVLTLLDHYSGFYAKSYVTLVTKILNMVIEK